MDGDGEDRPEEIVEFIKQDQNTKSSYDESINELKSLLNTNLSND